MRKSEIISNPRKILAVVIIFLAAIIIYSNTFQSSFHFDDYDSIVGNPAIKDLSDLSAIWLYWPTRFITYLTIAINYHFDKLNVFGYHLFNLIVHIGSGILVWWFTLLTLSTPLMKDKKIAYHADLIALFAGLVFVAQPVQTQGVTYIIQRTTSLAAFLYLASLCLYIKSRLLGYDSNIWRFYYYGSLATATLAMFTKEMTVTLPFIILLYELLFFKREGKVEWRRIIPFAALLLFPIATFYSPASSTFWQTKWMPEPFSRIPVGHYLLTQIKVLVTYLRLLFIPLNQNLDYDYPISRTLFELPTLASFILLIIILGAALKIISRYRLISFGIFWFFITLLPESSVVPIRDVIFEHRLYLPMVGFSLFLVALIYYLLGKKTAKPMIVMLVILVSFYSVLTYSRNLIWKDELSLWNDTVRKSPNKARPYNSRGVAYGSLGNLDLAINDFNKALAISPRYAEAYNNRGVAFATKGEIDKAISDFTHAIRINADYADSAFFNRGNAYYYKKDYDKALADFTMAIKINPDYPEAYGNRAIAYYYKGRYNESWKDVEETFSLGGEVHPEFLKALKKALSN